MNPTELHQFMARVEKKRQSALNVAQEFQQLVADIDKLEAVRIVDSTIAGDKGIQAGTSSVLTFDLGRAGKLPERFRFAFAEWVKDLNLAREMAKQLDPVSKSQILETFPVLED